MPKIYRHLRLYLSGLIALAILGGCARPNLPVQIPGGIPTVPSLPSLSDLPDLLRDLGMPDLSEIPDLPSLSDLPAFQVPEGAIAYAGPTERRLDIGQQIPGTDITLVGIGGEGAQVRIAGYRSVRKLGDSLDFDGAWPGIGGVHNTLRLRIYHIGDSFIRVAGVHRLVVERIQPAVQEVRLGDNAVKVPYSTSVAVGDPIHGTTFRYAGQAERGAEISGLPQAEYPFRKIGDSITWVGTVRSDIPARYDLRVLFYNDTHLQVGGLVTLLLP